MISKRLARQIKKNFGDIEFDVGLQMLRNAVHGQAAEDQKPELLQFIDAFANFLPAIDSSYTQLDDKALMAQRSIEISSKELTESNSELFELNQTFNALVNSLGQGFLLFGKDGVCLSVFSKACETLLETKPEGKEIAEVLRVPDEKRATFREWCNLLFEEIIEFDDLVELAPKFYEHSEKRIISLEFKPSFDREGKIRAVVMIATDRTNEVRLQQQAFEMHAFATMVTSILKDKSQFRNFVQVSREILAEALSRVERIEFDSSDLDHVKRDLHTLKGAAGTFGVLEVQNRVHEIETRVSNEADLTCVRQYLQQAIRDVRKLFESLLSRHREVLCDVLSNSGSMREIPFDKLMSFADKLERKTNSAIRADFISELVAIPMSELLAPFNGVLTETAKKAGKRVNPIEFTGEDIRVLPENYQALLSSLSHVYRNIADHGIEKPAERAAQGKAELGRVKCTTHKVKLNGRSAMLLVIEDDGAGIDSKRIRTKLKERGQNDEAEKMTDDRVNQTIFEAGFSTLQQVTSISGRGVGLDAVKYEVERMGGTITVTSRPKIGTTFTLRIPIIETNRAEPKALAS